MEIATTPQIKALTGKAATQQRILEAASRLFVTRGFEGTTISEVADAAGVSRATVFWHFSDKAGLFREAFSLLVKPFRDSLERDLSSLTPEKRLVEQIGDRLRRRRRAARRVAVVLDYSDGMRSIRQLAARPATANDFTLFQLARRTLMRAWTRRVRIRHVRLICDRLIFPPAQLELFADEQEQTQKRDHLIIAIDSIRHRFGSEALQVGRTLAA